MDPLWPLLTVLVLIALLAPRYGVDSRFPARGEPPSPPRPQPTPWGDLRAQAARIRSSRPDSSSIAR